MGYWGISSITHTQPNPTQMSVYIIGFNKFVTSYWKVFFIEYSITNVSLSLYRNIVNGTLASHIFSTKTGIKITQRFPQYSNPG